MSATDRDAEADTIGNSSCRDPFVREKRRTVTGSKFDISFSAELRSGADPEKVRRRLQVLFKLSDDALARMFSGRPVALKRGVDAKTAERYRDLFHDAGALVRIRPVEAADEPPPIPEPEPATKSAPIAAEPPRKASPAPDKPGLSLAPIGDQPLEPLVNAQPPSVDISHLTLISGHNWTLEDCETAQPPPEPPDVSHLEMTALDKEEGKGKKG